MHEVKVNTYSVKCSIDIQWSMEKRMPLCSVRDTLWMNENR